MADITDVVIRSFGSSVTPDGAVAAAELWTVAGTVGVAGIVVEIKSVEDVETVLEVNAEIVVANCSEQASISSSELSKSAWMGLCTATAHELNSPMLVEVSRGRTGLASAMPIKQLQMIDITRTRYRALPSPTSNRILSLCSSEWAAPPTLTSLIKECGDCVRAGTKTRASRNNQDNSYSTI